MEKESSWQLQMFRKSLKKQLKLKALVRHLDDLEGKKCLLITCGDNNGATNYHLARQGGHWTWADFEDKCLAEMESFLGDRVYLLEKRSGRLPFPDSEFDLVITIDVHEHLQDPVPLTRELCRVTKPGGKVLVTTPNGDEKKLVVRIKHLVGMSKEEYGHVRVGFDIPDLESLLKTAGLSPRASSSYSKVFTESLELVVNFAYVKVLSRKEESKTEKGTEGTIAPATGDQLKAVQKSYLLYSLMFPFFWTVSQLDRLLFFSRGYAVIVEARR